MMYFCPCPCNSPIDPETEESTFLALPRNLSYVQESYLDRHSVSARFVHNPKVDRTLQLEDQRSYHDYQAPDGEDDRDDHQDQCESQGNGIALGVSNQNSYDLSSGFHFDGYLQKQSPSPTIPIAVTTSPQTRPKLQSPDGVTLASPGRGSFMSRVAGSRLASFLSSKDHSVSSVPDDQDFGSSVDQPPSSIKIVRPQSNTPPSPFPDSQRIHSPDLQGLIMDRGEDLVTSHATSDHFSCTTSPSDASDASKTTSYSAEINHSAIESRDMGQEGQTLRDVADDNVNIQQHPYYSSNSYNLKDGLSSGVEGQTVKSFTTNGKAVFPRPEPHRQKETPNVTISPTGDDVTVQTTNSYESPDSDAFSEEGVFVNMMDDLDTNEKSTTVSEVSDDTCVSVDSMFLSPDEDEVEGDKTTKDSTAAPRMSMEEAISRAASDLSKMSMMMYPGGLESPDGQSVGDQGEEKSPKLSRTTLVRQSARLAIHLSHEDLSRPKKELTPPESPVYEDCEFNFNKKGLRKSSSLKTNKTPPGTPHRKKVVRFADAMGLDLESVRHVLNMESPPRIPPSAMADLKQGLSEDRKDVGSRYLCPCFIQPGASECFVQKVIQQKVCLENAIITDLTITGFVRVSNIAYHKSVRVRYTHNGWATFHDIAASYVLNSCDGATDRFSFSIVAPVYFVAGNRLEFAVSFNAGGAEFWDNNGGKNYAFECFAKTLPTGNETAWMHFL